ALINFDQGTWFPAPNYVVMKLWRDHFAPDLIAVEGGPQSPLNVAATATPDSRTVYLKCVNPTQQAVPVLVTLQPPHSLASAALELVNPGDLKARNTLTAPHQIAPARAPTTVVGRTVSFTMPALSAGVLTLQAP
ncbi:alpha-N-arabinofuranosidase, partial [bacterium]|nr:alpha-N-arabinofuranosidase [bacterium]